MQCVEINSGLLYLMLNYISSVLIVIINKILFQFYNFRYGTLLTVSHFTFTAVGLMIFYWLGITKLKRLEIKSMIPLIVVYALSVPLCSLSISYNTLGFYQISKTLIIPASVVLGWIWYEELLKFEMLFYIIPIILGSIITAETDIQVNMLGILFSMACVTSSALSQKWIQVKQKELKVDSFNLLMYIIPASTLVQIVSVPVLDDIDLNTSFEFDIVVVILILLSSIMACAVNISLFLALKSISPVSYQIVGQLKSISILASSFIIFGQQINIYNVVGMTVTIMGVVYYTLEKLKNK